MSERTYLILLSSIVAGLAALAVLGPTEQKEAPVQACSCEEVVMKLDSVCERAERLEQVLFNLKGAEFLQRFNRIERSVYNAKQK